MSPWCWPLKVSSPERAILEALDELPAHATFDNLDMIFQGLTNLRSRRLMTLLRACRSIKVKRLFFVFAVWLAMLVFCFQERQDQLSESRSDIDRYLESIAATPTPQHALL